MGAATRPALLVALLAVALVGPPRGLLPVASAQQQSQQQSSSLARGAGRKVGFTVEPREGPASGGTLVTLHMAAADVPTGHAKWWCSFGDKRVAAQSFFMVPSEQHGGRGNPALLCVAPAGPVRGRDGVGAALVTILKSGVFIFNFFSPLSSSQRER